MFHNALCGLAPTEPSSLVSYHSPSRSLNSGHCCHVPSSFLPQSLCTCCSLHLSCLSPNSAYGSSSVSSSSSRPSSASIARLSPPSASPLPSLSKELLSTHWMWCLSPSFPVGLTGSWGTSEWSHSKSPTPTQKVPADIQQRKCFPEGLEQEKAPALEKGSLLQVSGSMERSEKRVSEALCPSHSWVGTWGGGCMRRTREDSSEACAHLTIPLIQVWAAAFPRTDTNQLCS